MFLEKEWKKNGLQVYFGLDREHLRQILNSEFGAPKSHRPDEDDFEAADNTWFRLRFAGETLNAIEFINGSLEFDGIPLHQGSRWDTIAGALAARGHTFIAAFGPPDFTMGWLGTGHDCKTLGINIATRENVGGDEGDDSIEWVITSKDWSPKPAEPI